MCSIQSILLQHKVILIMITIPSVRPDTLKNIEVDFSSTIATAIWKKIVNNHTWVSGALPIGYVLFFQGGMTDANGIQIDPPNPNIWTPLDGSTINDPDSPLNGQTLPDVRDLFPKSSDTQGLIGGQSTINIQHNHGGQTGITDDRAGRNADDNNDHRTGSPHYHSIDNRWPTDEEILPKYFEVQAYIRYK